MANLASSVSSSSRVPQRELRFEVGTSKNTRSVLGNTNLVQNILSYLFKLGEPKEAVDGGIALHFYDMRKVELEQLRSTPVVKLQRMLQLYPTPADLTRFFSHSRTQFLDVERCGDRDLEKIPTVLRDRPGFKGIDLRKHGMYRYGQPEVLISGQAITALAERILFSEMNLRFPAQIESEFNPEVYGQLTQLRAIRFNSGMTMCPAHSRVISSLPSLTELDLGDCKGRSCFILTQDNPSLTKLKLMDSNLRDLTEILNGFPYVKSLDLSDDYELGGIIKAVFLDKIDGFQLSQLGNLLHVTTLNISHSFGPKISGIKAFLQNAPEQLTTLIIEPGEITYGGGEVCRITKEEIIELQREFPRIALVDRDGALFAPQLYKREAAVAAAAAAPVPVPVAAPEEGVTGIEE